MKIPGAHRRQRIGGGWGREARPGRGGYAGGVALSPGKVGEEHTAPI